MPERNADEVDCDPDQSDRESDRHRAELETTRDCEDLVLEVTRNLQKRVNLRGDTILEIEVGIREVGHRER